MKRENLKDSNNSSPIISDPFWTTLEKSSRSLFRLPHGYLFPFMMPRIPPCVTTPNFLIATSGFAVPFALLHLLQHFSELFNSHYAVTVRFQPLPSAPILKNRVFKISASQKFETVVKFLRKKLDCKDTDSVFCYVNSVFAPGLDEGVGGLWRVSGFCHAFTYYGTRIIVMS